jgi:hypothetical protein
MIRNYNRGNIMDLISIEQFKRVMPNKQLGATINDEMVTNINNLVQGDTALREVYRENLLSFTSVLATGKYKMQDYLSAVRYCSHKMLGDTNVVAYTKTFPDRYSRLLKEGATEKKISAFVAAYNKNKLVNLIVEQTLVPSHILNADVHQRAINTLASLMSDTTISPKVRSDSASSLLTHLKVPEATKVELDVSIKEDQSIADLRKATYELVTQQRKLLEAGASTAKEIAHKPIIIEHKGD